MPYWHLMRQEPWVTPMMELKPDLSDVIEGTHQQIFQREEDEKGLLEGSRVIKHNGKYYLLMISHVYAPGRHRREVCYRADDIHGPWEKQVILESEFGGLDQRLADARR